MALAPPDYSAGRTLLPALITVTLRRPASLSSGAELAASVPAVQEQAGHEEDVDTPMGGALSGARRVFHLWADQCAALPPAQGYWIEKDDGSVWIIKAVDLLAHGHRFRCQTVSRPGVP
jgi:hypothetical protein